MNEKMSKWNPWCRVAGGVVGCWVGLVGVAGAGVRYVDAVLSNTTLADGTALEVQAQSAILADSPPSWISRQPSGVSQAETANSHWHIRTPFGNGGEVFASASGATPFANTAPVLRTTISGLTVGETYEVAVYFWVAGNGAPTGNQEWDIRAGLEAASLVSFRHNTTGVVRLDTSGVVFDNTVVVTEADRRLFRAVLGTAVAGSDGTLPVYVSPFPGNDDRTWYDGVSYASVAPPPPATWTGGGGGALWSDVGNWQAAAAPLAGEILLFGDAALPFSENDLAADRAYGGLRFASDASAYEMSGNRFSLTGPLLNQSPSTQTIRNNLLLNGQLDCNLISGGLELGGVLSGSGGLFKSGSGVLLLAGENTYGGGTTLQSGSMRVTGNQSAAIGGWLVGPGTASATLATWEADSQIEVAATAGVRIGDNKGSLASSLSNQKLLSFGKTTNHGFLYVGLQGALDLDGTAVWQQNGPLMVEGFTSWTAQLTVMGEATLVYGGTEPIVLKSGAFQVSRGRLNVFGGALVTGLPIVNGTPEVLPGMVQMGDGGVLRVAAAIEDLAPGNEIVFLRGQGVVDTQGYAVGIGSPPSGAGALVKDGSGTLTLGEGTRHTGDTVVRAGMLALKVASLDDDASVDIAAGGRIQLDFEGTDVIGGLVLGGVAQGPGTYSAATHPTFFAQGAGSLILPSAGFTGWALERGLSGAADADFDGDSLADAVEYVIGSDPKVANGGAIQTTMANGALVFTFKRDDASETPDLVLSVEVGDDLVGWPQVFRVGPDTGSSDAGVEVEENGTDADTITVTLSSGGAPMRYARLRVGVTP